MRATLTHGLLAAAAAAALLLVGVPRLRNLDEAGSRPAVGAADSAARDGVAASVLARVEQALDEGLLVSVFVSKGAAVVTTTPRASYADPEVWLRAHRREVNRAVFRAAPAPVDWRPVLQDCAARVHELDRADALPGLVALRGDTEGVLHVLPHDGAFLDAWCWVEDFDALDRGFTALFPDGSAAAPRPRRRGPTPVGDARRPGEAPGAAAARFLDAGRLAVFVAGRHPETGEELPAAERAAVLRALEATAADA